MALVYEAHISEKCVFQACFAKQSNFAILQWYQSMISGSAYEIKLLEEKI